MVLVDLPLLAAISAVSLPLLLATHIDVMSAPFHLLLDFTYLNYALYTKRGISLMEREIPAST